MSPKSAMVVVILSGGSLIAFILSRDLSFAFVAIWVLLGGIFVNGIKEG